MAAPDAAPDHRVEALRRLFAEWGRGNFAAGADLLDPAVEFSWEEPPSVIRGHGRVELARRLRDFLRQWQSFRVEARRIVPLGEGAVLVESQQFTTGKQSGVSTELPMFIAFRFEGKQATAMHWSFDRSRAIAAAGGTERSGGRAPEPEAG